MSHALEVAVQALKDISQGSGRVVITDDILSSKEAFRAAFGSTLQHRAREALLEISASIDPRDPDPTREGMFTTHNCSHCANGTNLSRCPTPNRPGNCGHPRARND